MPELVEATAVPELPCGITGAIETRLGSDSYSVSMKKGGVWQISARTRTGSPPLDLDLTVIGPAGKELAMADDGPGTTDPELSFNVPEDGTYRVVVADRSGHSGHHGASYRLAFEKPREDFTATAPDQLTVPLGAQVKLPVVIVRRGGFKQAVRLKLEGLPAGVTVPEPLEIPAGKNDLTIDVSCAADAAASATLVEIASTTTLNGTAVTRPIQSLVVAAIMKPRIKMTPEGLDDVSKVRRGSTRLYPLLIERLDGFSGEVTLEMTSKQQRHRQGLASDEMVVPAEAKRVEYPIFVPEWMETTKTSRMILNGAVKVADPKGNVRTLLQRMDFRFGILPEGALMKLSHTPREFQASIGGELLIPLTIHLVAEFHEPVTIELVPNEDQIGLISAEALRLAAGETQCTLAVKLQDDTRLVGEQPFLLRATALERGKWLVKSETTVVTDVLGK
jgi:hypothetical protein